MKPKETQSNPQKNTSLRYKLPAPAKWMGMLLLILLLSACENNMRNQPRYKPLARSEFFTDGMASRPIPPNTIPQSLEIQEGPFYTGRSEDGQLLTQIPISITMQVLERGQERYNIFCSPCHGFVGDGQGMIVQRGFAAPPSFNTDRLRQTPAGHYFDVITNGFGQMYAYAYRIEPADRWAIVAYIRALQLSQNAQQQDLPPDILQQLEAGQ